MLNTDFQLDKMKQVKQKAIASLSNKDFYFNIIFQIMSVFNIFLTIFCLKQMTSEYPDDYGYC